MGTMTLSIGEQYSNPSGEGQLGVVEISSSACFHDFEVTAKTTSSVWIEWTEINIGTSFTKNSGTTINGETLTSDTLYNASLETFVSPNFRNNIVFSQIIVTLKDVQGGTVLSSITLSRRGTDLLC